MREGAASGTAYRVALRRAAHQLYDTPLVFDDPLALQIIGATHAGSRAATDLRAPARPSSRSLRAYLVARSRFAEDTLHHERRSHAVTQYVLLGAGLDTFAYRNTAPDLRVFEVDHPDTQRMKLRLLRENHLVVPPTASHVGVDFQSDDLAHCLSVAGFDPSRPAVFAWLGVVAYLTREGFASTLRSLSGYAQGSVLLFDYGLPRHLLPPVEQREFDSLAARVSAAGEPLRLFFEPHILHNRLQAEGWQVLEDLDRDAVNARYFDGRADHLRVQGSGPHFLVARLVGKANI